MLCVCINACVYLEAASFGGVQDEELLEQVLTVGGHVKGNPVFTSQHALSQFLEKDKGHGKWIADILGSFIIIGHIRFCQRVANS